MSRRVAEVASDKMACFDWLCCFNRLPMHTSMRTATMRTVTMRSMATQTEKVPDAPREKVLVLFGDSNFFYRPQKSDPASGAGAEDASNTMSWLWSFTPPQWSFTPPRLSPTSTCSSTPQAKASEGVFLPESMGDKVRAQLSGRVILASSSLLHYP